MRIWGNILIYKFNTDLIQISLILLITQAIWREFCVKSIFSSKAIHQFIVTQQLSVNGFYTILIAIKEFKEFLLSLTLLLSKSKNRHCSRGQFLEPEMKKMSPISNLLKFIDIDEVNRRWGCNKPMSLSNNILVRAM